MWQWVVTEIWSFIHFFILATFPPPPFTPNHSYSFLGAVTAVPCPSLAGRGQSVSLSPHGLTRKGCCVRGWAGRLFLGVWLQPCVQPVRTVGLTLNLSLLHGKTVSCRDITGQLKVKSFTCFLDYSYQHFPDFFSRSFPGQDFYFFFFLFSFLGQ